jgi:putative transposase
MGLSNTMTTEWCRDIAVEAFFRYGIPEIFNTDHGSQFTSNLFTRLLKDKGIKISMDSVGRAIDNIFIERFWRSIKYENVYLYSYENGLVLFKGLGAYIDFYNNQRPHQSLEYKTPSALYKIQAA